MINDVADDKLMLLEQLTYYNDEMFDKIGCNERKFIKRVDFVREYVDSFSKNDLQILESAGTIEDYYQQGSEIAAVIREIKKDEELMNLEIKEVRMDKLTEEAINEAEKNGKKLLPKEKSVNIDTICFSDPKHPKQAIVAFRGTLNGYEWNNDVAGMNEKLTQPQKDAIKYINGLDYDEITTVGHSNGANKSSVVAIMCPKVTRAVALDGQGVSDKFLDAYSEEVEKNASKITYYALANDFIHPLLYSIPGAKYNLVNGGGMLEAAENHSPNSFFHYGKKDEITELKTQNEKIYLEITKVDDQVIQKISRFSHFLMQALPQEEKDKVCTVVGNLLQLSLGSTATSTINENGKVYSKENISEYMIDHTDEITTVAAYALRFIEEDKISEEEVISIIQLIVLEPGKDENFVKRISSDLANLAEENPVLIDVIKMGMSEQLATDLKVEVKFATVLNVVIWVLLVKILPTLKKAGKRIDIKDIMKIRFSKKLKNSINYFSVQVKKEK